MSESPPAGPSSLVVGLAADPGLPTEIAEALAQRLPDELKRLVDSSVEWQIEVVSAQLHLDGSGQLSVPKDQHAMRDRGWDMMVGLTELPRRLGRHPLVLEVDTSLAAGWVSLPALGGLRLRSQTEKAVVALVDRIMSRHSDRHSGEVLDLPAVASPMEPLFADPQEQDGMQAASVRGMGSRLRLLFGMVGMNRPWKLVASLDSVFAAAAATAAFGVFYASVWNMADTLSPLRLALISAVAIGAMVGWLIFHNDLWERSSTHGGSSTQPRLYNATTVLTLLVGVASMYVLLMAATFLASMAVISGEYLEATLQHPVGITDYLQIAWFASSMGTVAGALGSNFETEAAVRRVAYGRRQRERLV